VEVPVKMPRLISMYCPLLKYFTRGFLVVAFVGFVMFKFSGM